MDVCDEKLRRIVLISNKIHKLNTEGVFYPIAAEITVIYILFRAFAVLRKHIQYILFRALSLALSFNDQLSRIISYFF